MVEYNLPLWSKPIAAAGGELYDGRGRLLGLVGEIFKHSRRVEWDPECSAPDALKGEEISSLGGCSVD